MIHPAITKVNIIGVDIAAVNLNSALETLTRNLESLRGQYVCVSNVHTTVHASEHPDYATVQNAAYMCVPDGKPLSIVGKLRGFPQMGRVTGMELMDALFRTSSRHFFYGNTEACLNTMQQNLKRDYPDIQIAGAIASVFRPLTADENTDIVRQINESQADYVWVSLGAPRQEIFMNRNQEAIRAVMVGVGGAFNIFAGLAKRAPDWMQRNSLEWLFRWMQEPRRLAKRYIVTNSKFIVYLLFKKNGLIRSG